MRKIYGVMMIGSTALALGAGTGISLIALGCWALAVLLALFGVISALTEERLGDGHHSDADISRAKQQAVVEAVLSVLLVVFLVALGML